MQNNKTPLTRSEIKQYNQNRKRFELDIMHEVLASRALAWRITFAAIVLVIIAMLVAGLTIFRYSQPLAPYLLTINKDTGEVSQLKMTRDKSSYGEEIDKYWLTQYIMHRESYDFYSIQADYDAVGLMSAPQVVNDYISKFTGKQGMDKVMGAKEYIRVKVRSAILDRGHQVATFRFNTIRTSVNNPDREDVQHWVVVMGYEYQALAMNAGQRFINPLGFRVTSYRLSTEIN